MNLKVSFNLSKNRTRYLLILDLFLFSVAVVFSLLLRFDFRIAGDVMANLEWIVAIAAGSMALAFYGFGLYKSLWEFASVDELLSLAAAALAGTLLTYFMFQLTGIFFPRSCYIIMAILVMALNGGVRFGYRALRRSWKHGRAQGDAAFRRILIFGGGEAGAMVVRELRQNPHVGKLPVAIIDDDPRKRELRIGGVPIVGNRTEVLAAVHNYAIDEIIIAIPTATRREIRDIVELCKRTKRPLQILPGVFELLDGQVSIKKLRDVNLEDLLGRDPVRLDLESITAYLKDRVVMVTGGGGSIGAELCRQVAGFSPRKLIILDNYENNAYDVANWLRWKHPDLCLDVLIASVRDSVRLEQIFREEQPQVIFHAAAHKHVPLMERNPAEAIKNNVLGTYHTARLADAYGVEKFIMISTDKAVNPTNVMGASKRCAEMIVQSFHLKSKTHYAAVRFGNVLGSNGSVIPLFREQINQGGPVTVTHPEIIRYFMTIPEAVQLVIQSGALAAGGEVFVLDMGDPVKIVKLAEDLIQLSGYEPYEDIDIVFTGLRPGEKLFEELLLDGEGIEGTGMEKIFIGKPLVKPFAQVMEDLGVLETVLEAPAEQIRKALQQVVPSYRPDPVTQSTREAGCKKQDKTFRVKKMIAKEVRN